VDIENAGAWAVMAIHLWNTDAAIRREFDNVADFGEWCQEEAERVIRSVVGVDGNE
jgi:hypothetical protein